MIKQVINPEYKHNSHSLRRHYPEQVIRVFLSLESTKHPW
jgi:hypothetical protein